MKKTVLALLAAVLILLLTPLIKASTLYYWGSYPSGTHDNPTYGDAKLCLDNDEIALVLWDQAKGEGYGFCYHDYGWWDETWGATDTVYVWKIVENEGGWEAVSCIASTRTDPPCEIVFLHFGDYVKVYSIDEGHAKFLVDLPGGTDYQVYLAQEASFLITENNQLNNLKQYTGFLEEYWWLLLAAAILFVVASKR